MPTSARVPVTTTSECKVKLTVACGATSTSHLIFPSLPRSFTSTSGSSTPFHAAMTPSCTGTVRWPGSSDTCPRKGSLPRPLPLLGVLPSTTTEDVCKGGFRSLTATFPSLDTGIWSRIFSCGMVIDLELKMLIFWIKTCVVVGGVFFAPKPRPKPEDGVTIVLFFEMG